MTSPEYSEEARMLDMSNQLEDLPHASRAFHRLLLDTMVSSQTVATCEPIDLETKEMPAPMVEAHYFPNRFRLSDFKGEITRYASDDMEPAAWQFDAAYRVNDTAYFMTGNDAATVLKTESLDGTELSYRFSPDIAGRFLAGIALGILRSGESFDPAAMDQADDDLSSRLIHYLYMIGNSNGQYAATQTSFITQPEKDRGLIIVKSERENKVNSAEDYKYRLVFKIGESMLADTTSHQHLVSRSEQNLATRFAERQPGYSEPHDLLFAELLQTDEDQEGVLFLPSIDRLEYTRVNAATMMFIQECLLEPKYRDLDLLPSIEEIEDVAVEGELLEELRDQGDDPEEKA